MPVGWSVDMRADVVLSFVLSVELSVGRFLGYINRQSDVHAVLPILYVGLFTDHMGSRDVDVNRRRREKWRKNWRHLPPQLL